MLSDNVYLVVQSPDERLEGLCVECLSDMVLPPFLEGSEEKIVVGGMPSSPQSRRKETVKQGPSRICQEWKHKGGGAAVASRDFIKKPQTTFVQ